MMEKFVVYIIYSETFQVYYKGFSLDVLKRLEEHNLGKSEYTRNKGPWKLVFYRTFSTKTEALKYEKLLKRQNVKYLEWLIQQPVNEIQNG
jgi:putative endonuclease